MTPIKSEEKIFLSILDENISLFEFLRKTFGISKSQIKKLNFKKSFLERIFIRGDRLELSKDIVNQNLISPFYKGPFVAILFEDDHFLVVNKPAGIHGHPLVYSDHHNILSFIRSQRDFKCLSLFSQNKERGLLYRLDSVTSGVLIFCKKTDLAGQLREEFEEKITSKIYLSIVEGDFNQEGEHTHFFEYIGQKASKAKVNDQGIGAKANSQIVKLAFNSEQNLSLLKVKLKTGLRHQIRAQLSFLGFPILGDVLYGGKFSERVFLHAYFYQIQESSEKKREFLCKDATLFDNFFDLNSIL